MWEAAFIPICCVHTHRSRSMGTLALQLRLQRPGYGGNKSEAGVPGKGNNGEGSLANLKMVGGKGTSDGKNGSDNTEENKEKKLTAYAGTKKKGSGSGTSSEKKSSKKADAVKDKTKEKTEASSTEESE